MKEFKEFAAGIIDIAQKKFNGHEGINHIQFIKMDFEGNISVYFNDFNPETPNSGFFQITDQDINYYIQMMQQQKNRPF